MKTALITGIAGNLGSVIATKFSAEGYTVVGTVNRTSPDNHFDTIEVDLTDESATGKMVGDVIAKYGNIDVLIATAGGFAMGDIAATKGSDVLAQYKLNFETAYHVARPVFTHMCQRGNGRIFLTGSGAGLDAANSKGTVAYSLTKSLLLRLAELLNEEAKGTDVVTSFIAPSVIDTPPNRTDMPNADFSRWVKPEAIADIIHFYCTDAASAIRQPIIKIYNKS